MGTAIDQLESQPRIWKISAATKEVSGKKNPPTETIKKGLGTRTVQPAAFLQDLHRNGRPTGASGRAVHLATLESAHATARATSRLRSNYYVPADWKLRTSPSA